MPDKDSTDDELKQIVDGFRQIVDDPERPERYKVQALAGYTDSLKRRGKARSVRVPLKTLERDGELLFVFPDAHRHERRVQRAVFSGRDRLFWITVTIACGAPGVVPGKRHRELAELAKRYGSLEKARNDLDAFYEYYRPGMIGTPFTVCPEPGVGKSPGFFDCAVRLDNPTAAQVQAAMARLRKWLEVNQTDPEFVSFQFNFCFSGHGDFDPGGSASIVIADTTLQASDLASLLLSAIPEQEVSASVARLDLYLDCCHAGAVAHSLSVSLGKRQSRRDPSKHSVLRLGQVYCASLDDEDSYELDELPHSVFTYAFLNECSRKRPKGAARMNIGLRDVGWHTAGNQHPLLLDFTHAPYATIKFPSDYYINRTLDPKVATRDRVEASPDPRRAAIDPLGEVLRLAHAKKTEWVSVEQDLSSKPELRIPFSRDEILTNRLFPFL